MRKTWSAKTYSRKNLAKTSRILIKNESNSTFKMKSLVSLDLTNSITRPFTARSLMGSSRALLQQASIEETEGLIRDDIKKIYLAKCKDLDIAHIYDQENRFLSFCSKSFCNRAIGLNENGLGFESIKVLSSIIKKNSFFCRLYLSKNNIGDNGVIQLALALKKDRFIISVDISSNDIGPEGSTKFFEILKENESLVSINISSLEGLRRNKLGSKGAEAVSELLKISKTLTHLNLGDTGLGKEGLEYITQGIAHNTVIVSFDISNNGFSHHSLEGFCQILNTTSLEELVLSGNKIGSKGCEIIAKMLMSGADRPNFLRKLSISMCEITYRGISRIFEALENNPMLNYLYADNNPLGKYGGVSIGKCLLFNSSISVLSLKNCDLQDEGIGKISEGLVKNKSLCKIFLSKNKINDAGAFFIAEALMKNSGLKTLDLSYNFIKGKGGLAIVNALKINKTLENLYVLDNSLKDECGRVLAEITRNKPNLMKVQLNMNPINLKYIKEINKNLERNYLNHKQLLSPRIRKEIEKLTITDRDIEGVFLQIQDKAKEKLYYLDKIKLQNEKMRMVTQEKHEKLAMIQGELEEIKGVHHMLSKNLEDLMLEMTKLKFGSEKQVKEYLDLIAFATQDVKKLEKQSKT